MADTTAGDSMDPTGGSAGGQTASTTSTTGTVTFNPTTTEVPARTFTQEDVDRIVQERLARAKTTPPPDYDDLKAAAARLAEIEEASKSELEREREAREKAEAEAQKIRETAERRLIEAAVLAEGTKQNALKPEHLHKLIDTGEVTVGDDGQVTGVAEAITAFLSSNPEYVGTSRPVGSADQGAREGGKKQLSREALKSMSPEQIVQARKEGRLDAVLAGS